MSEPILYVDRSEVLEGKREDLDAAMKELVAFVEENEPQLISYGYFLDDTGTRMSVVAIHPDPASMEFHMNIGGPGFRKAGQFLRLEAIDVYGEPGEKVLGLLQAKAEMLGGGTVSVHRSGAGFTR